MKEYPYVTSSPDRHGKIRHRFRRGKVSKYLPGQPGDAEFDEHYNAIIEDREPRQAEIVLHPGAVVPRSFAAAWRIVKTKSPTWHAYKHATKSKNIYLTDMFLNSRVAADEEYLWRDMLVEHLKRRHVKSILTEYADTPHKAKHLLVAIRRLIEVGLDQEWIEVDPTYKIKWNPKYVGFRAWTIEERKAFEERWPIGTTPRLAYCLALWLGLRRVDIALAHTDWVNGDKIRLTDEKTGKPLVLPISEPLKHALDARPNKLGSILVTAYGEPFSAKSLTGNMAKWTKSAGLAPGCTLHGLRKTLGKYIAEAGGSTRESMGMLGHDDIEQAELYSREAEQERLAREAMRKVETMFG